MKTIEQHQLIIAKCLPQTNHKPYRLKLINPQFNESIIISTDSIKLDTDNNKERVQYLLEKNGFDIVGYYSGKDQYYFFCKPENYTFRRFDKKEWVLYWKGEEVDTTDNKTTAEYLKKEYEIAFKSAVTMKTRTIKFIRQ